jgi:hypothetical protein
MFHELPQSTERARGRLVLGVRRKEGRADDDDDDKKQ